MKNLWRSLRAENSLPKSFLVVSILVALLGFADASYLTIEHYRGATPPCFIVSGCGTVTTSVYSQIGPIPVALLGALYYFTISLLLFLAMESRKDKPARIAFLLTPFGILASGYFLYVQIFLLKAYCLYCLGSIATSTILFMLAVVADRMHKKN